MTTLFTNLEPARARNTDPETSHEAAAKVTLKVGSIRWLVLQMFEAHGQMCDGELCRRVPFYLGESTARGRRAELVTAGYVEPVPGVYATTESGNRTKVWRLTDAGRAALSTIKEPE